MELPADLACVHGRAHAQAALWTHRLIEGHQLKKGSMQVWPATMIRPMMPKIRSTCMGSSVGGVRPEPLRPDNPKAEHPIVPSVSHWPR